MSFPRVGAIDCDVRPAVPGMRALLAYLSRLPSEYVREQMWFTTQPMDEPERSQGLLAMLDWIGRDRILFATDYPHWDFDATAVKAPLSGEQAHMVFRDNARAV